MSADKDFHVVFEAETGTSEDTYIAIDDVSFTPVRFVDGLLFLGLFLIYSFIHLLSYFG